MDPLDPAYGLTASYGWRPFITLIIFACLGSFFFGALITAIGKGNKLKSRMNIKDKN